MSVTVVFWQGVGNVEDMSITLAAFHFTMYCRHYLQFKGVVVEIQSSIKLTATGSNTDVAEFRLRCLDIDASDFVHWSVDNIKACRKCD